MAEPKKFPLDEPIVVVQGSRFEARFQDLDPDGNVVSYAGYTAEMQVRDEPGGTLRWQGSTDDGRLVVGPQDDGAGTTWQVMIVIPGTDIVAPAFPAGYVGRYELKLTSASGVPSSYLLSSFCVEGAIVE